MKKSLFLVFAFSVFLLFSCSNSSPSQQLVNNEINESFGNEKMTSDAVELANKIDKVESLESQCSYFNQSDVDLANSNNQSSKLNLLSEVERDYTDITNPSNDYYSGKIDLDGFAVTNALMLNNYIYNDAIAAKDQVLRSCPIINAWYYPYGTNDFKMRISFSDDNKIYLEMIDKSMIYDDSKPYSKLINGDYIWYKKVFVEVDSNNKIHYTYLMSGFDSANVLNGLFEQNYIEYYEDQYYNFYSISRTWESHYDFSSKGKKTISESEYDVVFIYKMYEVDLSKDEPIFYSIYDYDTYKVDINIGTYEHINSNTPPSYFLNWFVDGNFMSYGSTTYDSNSINRGFYIIDKYGKQTLNLSYVKVQNSNKDEYEISINLYELNGIKSIKKYSESEIEVEFNNGMIINSLYSSNPSIYGMYYGNNENVIAMHFDSSNLDEAKEKLNYYGITFKNIDFDYYKNLIVDNADIYFKGDKITNRTNEFLSEYVKTKVIPVNVNEVTKEYDNVDEIKEYLKINIKCKFDGNVSLKDKTVIFDQFSIKVNEMTLNDKQFELSNIHYIEITYKEQLIKTIPAEFINKKLTFSDEIDISKYDTDKMDTKSDFKIRFVGTGIILPLEIN